VDTLLVTLAFLVGGMLAAVLGTLGAVGRLDDVASWHLIGGLASAAYISAGIVPFPRLGALVSVALFVAGQLIASVVLDGFGLLGLPRERVLGTDGARRAHGHGGDDRDPEGFPSGVGAAYVTVSLLAVPEIGAAPTIAPHRRRAAAGLGPRRSLRPVPAAERPMTLSRVAGVLVLVAGAAVLQLTG
jgi:uncharacterized membrane protein YdcZ (DUF606 family)